MKLILFKTVRRDGIEFITKCFGERYGDSRLLMDKFVRHSIDCDSIAITILHFRRLCFCCGYISEQKERC